MDLISIVIPLYNKELYIARTLNSILDQTYTDFECIIIDSSNDGSTNIVKTYSDPRIRHIIRGKTSAAAARNIGVSMAQSELIAFLDADDEWNPVHLETLVRLYNQFPHAGIYSTPYVKFLFDGSPMVMIFRDIPPPPWEGIIPRYFITCAKGDVPICSSNCAIPKQIYCEMGGFFENLIYGEDQHLWGRIALSYPVVYSWKGPALYHTDAGGRICNVPHDIDTDPFSQYIMEKIDRGQIHPDLIPDLNQYIKRRGMTQFLSKMLQSHLCGSHSQFVAKDSNYSNLPYRIKKRVGNSISSILCGFFQSHVYNIIRAVICILTRTYIPIYPNDQNSGVSKIGSSESKLYHYR